MHEIYKKKKNVRLCFRDYFYIVNVRLMYLLQQAFKNLLSFFILLCMQARFSTMFGIELYIRTIVLLPIYIQKIFE